MNVLIAHIIDTAVAVVAEQELVLDGVGSNYRETLLTYTTETHVVTELRAYAFPPDSEAWATYTSSYSIREVSND